MTSPEAIGHLAREGRPSDAIHLVGNPMIDTLLASMAKFDTTAVRTELGLPDSTRPVQPGGVSTCQSWPSRASVYMDTLRAVA